MKKVPAQKLAHQLKETDNDSDAGIDSGDESDGKSALRNVEAREEPRAARRGPGNASMQHFHDPIATVDRSGQKRWEFRCRFCVWYVSIVWNKQAMLTGQIVHAASKELSMAKI